MLLPSSKSFRGFPLVCKADQIMALATFIFIRGFSSLLLQYIHPSFKGFSLEHKSGPNHVSSFFQLRMIRGFSCLLHTSSKSFRGFPLICNFQIMALASFIFIRGFSSMLLHPSFKGFSLVHKSGPNHAPSFFQLHKIRGFSSLLLHPKVSEVFPWYSKWTKSWP